MKNNVKKLGSVDFEAINAGHGIEVFSEKAKDGSVYIRIYTMGSCGSHYSEIRLFEGSSKNGSINPEDLEKIGNMFISSASELRKIQNEGKDGD